MAVTTSDVQALAARMIATGFIKSYGLSWQNIYCDFNYTYTYTSGALNTQVVKVRPKGTAIVSPRVADGIQFLPGGRVFSPWSLANSRAPVAYPSYTQTMVYSGDTQAVMHEYEKVLSMVGVTAQLRFDYGRQSGETFGAKNCLSMLLPIAATAERVLDEGKKTWIEVTCSWQQVGDFYY